MAGLDPRAIEKVNGPSWDELRESFLDVSGELLAVGENTDSALTTIYVKYKVGEEPSSPVYAVAWIKTAKQFVVGLRLPPEYDSPLLDIAPKGMTYKGLTKYFTMKPGESVPEELPIWAREAYLGALSESDEGEI